MDDFLYHFVDGHRSRLHWRCSFIKWGLYVMLKPRWGNQPPEKDF